MTKSLFRKTLSAPGLLRIVRGCFDKIPSDVAGRGLSLSDCLMSALAMFGLKYVSLLSFDRDVRSEERIRSNLRNLYGVSRAPSDTAMRERLDEVDPAALRVAFKRVFAALQRGKGLMGFTWLGHRLEDHRGKRRGADACGPRPVAHRKRDFQHPTGGL